MKRPRHPFLLLCTLAMLIYALVPIVTVIAFSFNPLPFYAFPITGFTGKWYTALVADPRIGASLLASLGIATLVALLATLLGTLFAFFVVRAQARFKRLWVAFGFLPLVVPVLVLAAGLQVAFVELGLPLGYPTVIIGHTLYTSPFVALMVMAQLLRYDERLDEAARDLGASQRQMLRHVTLPILWPSIRSGLLLAFLLSFNEWAIAFFTGRGFNTLPMLIYSMARNGLPPSVLAYSALAVGCVLLVAGMILPFALKLIRGRA
ncbi:MULTISPECIES: ABC transporter permease [Pseudomonas]|uniref:ABC transporter permease n=1 Tax=Pseudomonas TaxID=286 RepID=UPI00249B82DE|nr:MULTISPECIES: ABC transporter permease subunit [Pseudomonas]